MEENMNNEDIVLEEGTVQVVEPTEEIQEVEDAPIPPQEKRKRNARN